jgi:hypothetical protein
MLPGARVERNEFVRTLRANSPDTGELTKRTRRNKMSSLSSACAHPVRIDISMKASLLQRIAVGAVVFQSSVHRPGNNCTAIA